jgi:protein SCO1/2
MSLGTKLFLSLLLLAAGGYTAFIGYRMWDRGQEYDPKRTLNLQPTRPLADFEFTERDGRRVKLTDLAGDIVVVNFFFANCPGSCRQFTSTISGLQTEFKNDDVRFVSVTVDPSTDTPDRLTTYANQFGADPKRWWFVNAPLSETQELGRSLHVTVVGTTHTDELILIDRDGTIRGTYDHKDPQKLTRFKNDLKALIAEKAT